MAGVLLFTLVVVCKRICKQFFYSQKLKKNLVCITRKEKQLYLLPSLEITAFTIGLVHPKIVISEGVFQTFTEEEVDAIILHEEHNKKKLRSVEIISLYIISRGNDICSGIERHVIALSNVSRAIGG